MVRLSDMYKAYELDKVINSRNFSPKINWNVQLSDTYAAYVSDTLINKKKKIY